MILTLGKTMIDWLTVTSFQKTAMEYWQREIDKEIVGDWAEGVHIPRYVGKEKQSSQGHVWLGEGSQKNQPHYMLTCGGQNSDAISESCLYKPLQSGWAKTTVIHIQITLRCGKEWNQRELYQRLESRGKRPSNWSSLDSKGRERTTVYLGSMKSSKYSRTYVKDIGKNGEFIIRHEIVYKGDYARGLAKMLTTSADSQETMNRIMWRELVTFDDHLSAIASPFIARFGKAKVQPEHHDLDLLQTKRAWLLGSVLPAFADYINDHDADDTVMEVFASAINNVYYGRHHEGDEEE